VNVSVMVVRDVECAPIPAQAGCGENHVLTEGDK